MGMQPGDFWTCTLEAVGPTPVPPSYLKAILASVHWLLWEQWVPVQGCAVLHPFSTPYSYSFDSLILTPKTNVFICCPLSLSDFLPNFLFVCSSSSEGLISLARSPKRETQRQQVPESEILGKRRTK